jgi:selenocysteine lyase/cysteine desulfurase
MGFSFREFNPAQTAHRYEAGQLNFPGFAGMGEAIALLQSFGPENVWQRILALVDRLVDGLQRDTRVQLRSCLDEESRSGIVNVACQDPDSASQRLMEHGVVVSVRGGGLRISPHFYNTEKEIDKLISELKHV